MQHLPPLLAGSNSSSGFSSGLDKIVGAAEGQSPSAAFFGPRTRWKRERPTASFSPLSENPLSARYALLFAAVNKLAALPPEDPGWVSREGSEEALDFLSLLRAFEVAPPKIFPHGGDAISFVWSTASGRRYITAAERRAALYETSQRSLEYVYRLDDPHELSRLMKLLGGRV